MKEIELRSSDEIAKQTKADFLSALEDKFEDEFLPRTMSASEKKRVIELTGPNETKQALYTAIPMTCRAEKCEFRKTCPLFQEGIAPLDNPCPLEMKMVINLMAEFMEHLDVDMSNIVEVVLVRDIVNQEIQTHRATKILAQESFIQENVIGVDSEGDPIMQKQLHLASDYEDKIFKRRQQLFKTFIATRADRAKAGLAAIDSAAGIANLMNSFSQVQRQKDEQTRRELGIVDVDSYIEGKKRAHEDEQEG